MIVFDDKMLDQLRCLEEKNTRDEYIYDRVVESYLNSKFKWFKRNRYLRMLKKYNVSRYYVDLFDLEYCR